MPGKDRSARFALSSGPPDRRSEIAAKVVDRDDCTFAEFGCECALEDALGGDALKSRLFGSQDVRRSCADRALELLKSLTPARRRRKIGHILPEYQLEGVGRRQRRGRSIVRPEHLDRFPKSERLVRHCALPSRFA